MPRPGRFTPGKDPVPIVQETGWAPGPVWTCAENLASTGIRVPDRPVRRQSLYRLRYPGPLLQLQIIIIIIIIIQVYLRADATTLRTNYRNSTNYTKYATLEETTIPALNRRSDKIRMSEDKNIIVSINWILQKAKYKRRYKFKKTKTEDDSSEG